MNNLFSLQNGQPHGAIPFSQISSSQFLPLLKTEVESAKEKIKKIKDNKAPASFANTIEALEFSSLELDRMSSVFFNLLHACSDELLEKDSDAVSALLAGFSNDIQLDSALFEKIRYVYDQRDSADLSNEQKKLLEKYYLDFARNGALLSEEKKEQLRKLDMELAQISPRFGQNLLKATNNFVLRVQKEEDLAGLPESARTAAQEMAKDNGAETEWHFSLHAPSFIPFMTYAENRSLRKTLWLAYNQRTFGVQPHSPAEFSNKELCEKITHLRAQRAELLGYKSHAHFVLERRMAKTPQTVYDFIQKLQEPSVQAAKKEMTGLRGFKKKITGDDDFMPWDFAFYSEKWKQELFNYSEEDLRPYFPLEQVIQGVFQHAQRLFGLQFQEAEKVPVYHPDVKVFEVTDTKGFVGLLYFDIFPRDNKRGGAWMTTFLDQGSTDGKSTYRPHVSIVCSFTKPTKESPSLLTFNEVQTLFHEFGHALHSLLSNGRYPSISGTNVLWDFVELPSQIMENWALQKETLYTFARHYKTGEPLPENLFEALKKSKNFLAGYGSLRQISFSLIDMAWHDRSSEDPADTAHLEEKIMGPFRVLPAVPGTNFSVSFSHIFAGGYSAGYYSYKWAEVLDADAFALFQEKGIYDPETARRFRDEILSRGGSEDPAILFKNFRGRDPDPQALLRRSGLIS